MIENIIADLPTYGALGLWVAYMVFNEVISKKEMRQALDNNTKMIKELTELIHYYGSK